MRHLLAILAGAGFTVATSIAAGSLLLRRLRLSLYWEEALPFEFLAGASLVSLSVFLLCLGGEARWPLFLAGGITVIAWAWWGRSSTYPKYPRLPISQIYKYIFF